MAGGQTGLASAFGFALAVPPPAAARGPSESWIVPAADLEAWLKSAQTGETFIYCHGPCLIQGAAAARVRDLAAAGEVIPHHVRVGDGGFDFIVRRNRVRLVVARPRVCDAQMLAVLLVIQDAADNAERCPSDAAIADAADLRADQVKWQLKKLEEARLIERRTVPAPGDARFRVVRVTATGAETAGPGGSR